MKQLSSELKLKNSLEISNLFSYLLWNGYLSKNKEFTFTVKNRKNINGLKFADISNGIGVCLNIADMLNDFLLYCNYETCVLDNFFKNDTVFDYEMNIGINEEDEYEDDNFFIDFLDNIKEDFINLMERMILSKSSNHCFNLIKDNAKYYIYDATNLSILEIKDFYTAALINGKGDFLIKPYSSCLCADNLNMKIKLLEEILYSKDLTSPYNKESFIEISDSNILLFKDNISLIDDFYVDARDSIIGISKSLDSYDNNSKKLLRKI